MKQNFSNSPLDKAERRISIYTNKILLATKKMPDDDPNKSTILALCGQKGRSMNLLASDADARRELYEQIAKLMQEKRKHEPGLCFYHLTLFDDSGVTSDRSPVVDILALRAKADRALRRLALSGIL